MKYLVIISFFLISALNLEAQATDMNTNIDRVYNFTTEQRTVHPILQSASQLIGITEFEDVYFTLENAVAQNPNSVEALLSRARYRSMVGMSAEAKADIKLANNINPYLVDLYGFNGVGGLLNIMAFEPEEALYKMSTKDKLIGYSKYLKKSLKRKYLNDDKRAKYSPIMEKMDNGFYEEALVEVDKLAETELNNPVVYDLRGYLLKYLGDVDGAVDAFILTTSIEPSFYISWYNLGLAERKIGLNENAMKHLNKCIEIQPEFILAYLERASLYKELGHFDLAIEDYNKVIELHGNGYAEAYLNRGLTKMLTGDYSSAIMDLNKIIEEFPEDEQLRFNRGNLNLVLGFLDKAYDDFTTAIELNRNYGEAYYNRGLINILRYNQELACEDFMMSQDKGYDKIKSILPYFCNN